MISTLLHLVGLRPRVYYTLINFRGGGGKAPLPPPSIRQWTLFEVCNISITKNSFDNLSIFIMDFATIIDAKYSIMVRDADCQHTSLIIRSLGWYIGIYIIYKRCRTTCNSCMSINRWKTKIRGKNVLNY